MFKKISILCISTFFFFQCSLLFRTSVPIKMEYHQIEKTKGVDTLVIFLPGRQSKPEDFSKEGFVSLLKKQGIKIDSVAVDAHLGYYINRNLLERLRFDVVLPARERGYRKIWIVGISMGGLGALLYNEKHNDTIDGVLVLAPYLGDQEVIDEIQIAGGLKKWNPLKIDKGDYQRKLWFWLKKFSSKNKLPPLMIGYGRDDRFARANSLLAEVLPKSRVYTVPGGHDWGPWKRIFEHFTQKRIFNIDSRL